MAPSEGVQGLSGSTQRLPKLSSEPDLSSVLRFIEEL